MTSETKSASPVLRLWCLASLALLGFGFFTAMTAPTEATMGNLYRVFFWHFPHTIWSFVFPYANLLASLLYLFWRQRKPRLALKADAFAVASADLTVLFATIGLATGMIWARPAWGIWWTWDARLTTYLLLWLLYVSYLILRRYSAGDSTALLAAVLAIFAAADIPICFMSIRWWRTQHPAPVFGGGADSGIDPTMLPAVFWNLGAFLVWGCFLLAVRYQLERRRQQNAEALVAQYLADPAIQPQSTLEAR